MSIAFPREEYWSGLPFPSTGDLPDPGTEPVSPALAGKSFTAEPPGSPMEELSNMLKKISQMNEKEWYIQQKC